VHISFRVILDLAFIVFIFRRERVKSNFSLASLMGASVNPRLDLFFLSIVIWWQRAFSYSIAHQFLSSISASVVLSFASFELPFGRPPTLDGDVFFSVIGCISIHGNVGVIILRATSPSWSHIEGVLSYVSWVGKPYTLLVEFSTCVMMTSASGTLICRLFRLDWNFKVISFIIPLLFVIPWLVCASASACFRPISWQINFNQPS
jgi:hypothetical protein